MARIDSVQNFVGTIGPVTFKGYFVLTEPRSDSFAQGTAELMGGITSFAFLVRCAGPSVQLNLSNINVTISFDLDSGALLGDLNEDQSPVSRTIQWKTIASLPPELRS